MGSFLLLSVGVEARTLMLTPGSVGNSVTSDPPGISCGTAVVGGVTGINPQVNKCSANFPDGTVVKLQPHFDSYFPSLVAWPGCVNVNDNSKCVVVMTQDVSLSLPIFLPSPTMQSNLKSFGTMPATTWANLTTCPTDKYIVPPNVYFLSIQAVGGNGAEGFKSGDNAGGQPGYGAVLSAVFPVQPGQKLFVVAGENGTYNYSASNTGSMAGGGRTHRASGGGLSFVSTTKPSGVNNSCLVDPTGLLILAGGGGGGGDAGAMRAGGGTGANAGLWIFDANRVPNSVGGTGQRGGGVPYGTGGGGGTLTMGGGWGTTYGTCGLSTGGAFQGGGETDVPDSCPLGSGGGAGGGGYFGGGPGGGGSGWSGSGGGGGGGGSSFISSLGNLITGYTNNGGPRAGITIQPVIYTQ